MHFECCGFILCSLLLVSIPTEAWRYRPRARLSGRRTNTSTRTNVDPTYLERSLLFTKTRSDTPFVHTDTPTRTKRNSFEQSSPTWPSLTQGHVTGTGTDPSVAERNTDTDTQSDLPTIDSTNSVSMSSDPTSSESFTPLEHTAISMTLTKVQKIETGTTTASRTHTPTLSRHSLTEGKSRSIT
eukprot:PhF_6_TR1078/c0_g1_i1/m.2307